MGQLFTCPSCNAPLDYEGGNNLTVRCPYCNSVVIVPESLRRRPETPPDFDVMLEQVSRRRPERLRVSAASLPASPEAAVEEIVALLEADQKIQAIKLYRHTFGVGLREAKEAVEQLAQGKALPLPEPVPLGWREEKDDLGEVVRLAQSGDKLEAIKLYRETYDVSLVEAKDIVEQLEAGIPPAQARVRVAKNTAVRPRATGTTPSTAATAGSRWACLGIALFLLLTVVLPIGVPIVAAIDERTHVVSIWGRNLNPWSKATTSLAFGKEGEGPGLFTRPDLIAVDGDGYIYVTNRTDSRIQRFDANGNYTSAWMINERIGVRSLAATREGIVYVLQDRRIYRFEGATGQLLGEVEYSVEGTVEEVVATADGGILILVDFRSSDGWLRYDAQGRLVQTVEAVASEDGSLDHLAVDSEGNVYALGDVRRRSGWIDVVYIFTAEGNFVTWFGSNGEQPGQFTSPGALAADSRRRIHVSDFGGILVFDANGRYLHKLSAAYSRDIKINDQDQLYLINYDKVIRYDLK